MMEQGLIQRMKSSGSGRRSIRGLLLLGLILAWLPLEARIGDSRSRLAERITADRLGFEVPEATARQWVSQSPLNRWIPVLGPDFAIAAYFKSATGDTVTLTDLQQERLPSGWRLVVLYLNDISVLEFYQRTDGRRPVPITRPEQEGLLARHLEGDFWLKSDHPEAPVVEATVFGSDFVLSNGRLRAKVSQHDLLLYRPELDERFAQEQVRREAEEASRAQAAAPASLRNF